MDYKYGDEVDVVVPRVTLQGTIHLKVQKATFIRLDLTYGKAEVKMRNGRDVWVDLNMVTPAGEKNALTKALMKGA